MARIFISYAHDDQERVAPIYLFLRLLGHSPWMDTFDLLPGQRWEIAIGQALKQSGFILLAISSRSTGKRGFIQKEIRIALDLAKEMLNEDIYLIPVRLDECHCPGEIAQFQYVDVFEQDGLIRLLKALETGRHQRDIRPPGESNARNLVGWLSKHGGSVMMGKRALEFTFSDVRLQCMFDTNADRMRLFVPVAAKEQFTTPEVKKLLEANFLDTRDARYACDGEVVYAAFLHPLSSLSEVQFYRGARCIQQLHGSSSEACGRVEPVGQASSQSLNTTEEMVIDWIKDNYANVQFEGDSAQIRQKGVELRLTLNGSLSQIRITATIQRKDRPDYGKILDANFHSVLDPRYALNEGSPCVVYHHGLSEMDEGLLFSAVDQVVTAALTFGKENTSGAWILRRLDGQ